jgi:hypothetical protein
MAVDEIADLLNLACIGVCEACAVLLALAELFHDHDALLESGIAGAFPNAVDTSLDLGSRSFKNGVHRVLDGKPEIVMAVNRPSNLAIRIFLRDHVCMALHAVHEVAFAFQAPPIVSGQLIVVAPASTAARISSVVKSKFSPTRE